MRHVPFLDLRITDLAIRQELLNAIETVFEHGRFIMGPEVEELESKIATSTNRKYAVGVNSGTDALFLALKSLGIGSGDEVITTSLSWIATANAIKLTGASPVFADVRTDLNIDPLSADRLITPKTKAILPVHYTGKIALMADLVTLAQQHRLWLIEDAAQAFGAELNNQIAGSFGDIACFSMNPMKVLGAYGEAGMVVTDDEDIYNRLITLRYNGMVDREVCIEPSLNGRLDTLQAALLLKQLNRTSIIIRRRREIAKRYNAQLTNFVTVPRETKGRRDVYYTYTIQSSYRNQLKQFLKERGIEAKIRDPYLMPQQPAYRQERRDNLVTATRLVDKLLCLPAHEKMDDVAVDYVIAQIKTFFNEMIEAGYRSG